MSLKKFKILFYFIPITIIFYFVHFIIFRLLKLELNQSIFNYSLKNLYFLFAAFSVVIILTIIIIKQKNIDLVGNVFLLLTCIKSVIFFIIIRPLTVIEGEYVLEKFNFLGLFMLFLTLETLATITILNDKN